MAELLFRAQERPVEHHIVQANGSLNPDYGPGLLANEFSEKSGLCQHPFGLWVQLKVLVRLKNPPKSPFRKGGLHRASPLCKGGPGGIL